MVYFPYPEDSVKLRETYLTPGDMTSLNRGDTITKLAQDNSQIDIHPPPGQGVAAIKLDQLSKLLDGAERLGDGMVSVQAVRGALSGT